MDGHPRSLPTIGQKFPFKLGALRRLTRPTGLAHPTGLELVEIEPPKGRVKPAEEWKTSGKRMLIVPQEEVTLDKFFKLEGEDTLAGEPAWRLSVRIEPFKRTLAGGAQVDLSGTGEVWIARQDGRILKATEVLDGQLRDEKLSKEAGRFAQAMVLVDAAGTPGELASLLAASARPSPAPAPAPATAASTAPAAAKMPAAPPAAPVPAVTRAAAPATPASGGAAATMQERIVFVSSGSARREVWAVAPDGTGKKCLTPFAYEHWSPSIDPDGRLLACASRRATGVNLWLFNLGGGDAAAVTSFGERDDVDTAWCNGGQRLVFLKSGKLWAVHQDGFNLQSFDAGGRAVGFAACPSTSLVAVVVSELNQDKIVSVDIINGEVHAIGDGDLPSWSPDGSQLMFRTAEGLMVVNADGSGMKLYQKGVFADAPLLWIQGTNGLPGKRIVATKVETAGENIVVADATPLATVTRVTTRGGRAVAAANEASNVAATGYRIAYLLSGDLWTATVDGLKQVQLTADGNSGGPVWWGKLNVP